MSMSDEDRQWEAWNRGWRPAGYRTPDALEEQFLREHPDWLQAAWVHPVYNAWRIRREAAE